MLDSNPSQRQLVRRFIDWDVVEHRLQRFAAVGRAFPIRLLRSREGTPPYYCHYMAWRLGTWTDESLLQRLEGLLTEAEKLPEWRAKSALLESADFSDFWSLVWELQVAEYLCSIGSEVQWAASGPDLAVAIGSEKWFVECYVYRKSFGLMLFIEEVLTCVDPSIRVEYNLCMPFSLPNDKERSGFLHSLLSPFLDRTLVEDARARSTREYPVLLGCHDSSLTIYMDGDDPRAYVPGIAPGQTGDAQKYLGVALKEAIGAKQYGNSLATHRPNLLAVNYILSADPQLALGQVDNLSLSLPAVELGANIDVIVITAVGIDGRLARCGFKRVASAVSDSLALDRMTCSA